jgi:hypothetical protein
MTTSFPDDQFWRYWRDFERSRVVWEQLDRARRDLGPVLEAEKLRRDMLPLFRLLDASQPRLPPHILADWDRARQIVTISEQFGRRPWDPFSTVAFRDAVSTQRLLSGLEQILSPWEGLFDRSLIQDVATSLGAVPPEQGGRDIVAVVANAVSEALARDRKRTDSRFVWGLIIGVLTGLALMAPNDSSDSPQEATIDAIRADVAATRRTIDIIATRLVNRPTVLRSRPASKAASIRLLPPGSVVVPTHRYGRWTMVRVLGSGPDSAGKPVTGWLLNKYLESEP